MTTSSQPLVSRRQLISGVLIGSAIALVAQPPQQASASMSDGAPSLVLGEFPAVTSQTFDRVWSIRYASLFPVEIALNEGTAATLRVSWDRRLFAIGDAARYVVDGATYQLGASEFASNRLGFDLPAGVSRIILSASAINLYPFENIEDVEPTVVELWSASGHQLDRHEIWATASADGAWSLEATVDWTVVGGVVLPERVNIESVGPRAVPSGVVVSLVYPALSDPTLLDERDELSTAIAIQSEVVSGVTRAQLTVIEPLLAGIRLHLLFPVPAPDSVPAAFPANIPRLLLDRSSAPAGLRLSGKHAAFPITPSGSQLSTYLAPEGA